MSIIELKYLSIGIFGLSEKPTHIDRTQSNIALIVVVIAHGFVIGFLMEKLLINPPKLLASKPMQVSLIAPPAPESQKIPELVPMIELAKSVAESKPKLKKIVKEIRPIQMPTEHLVEASTEQLPVVAQPVTAPIAQEAPATKASPAAERTAEDKAVEDKIEPPKFGVAYLNNPAPDYPKLSRRMGEEGRVLLRVLVSESGAATEVNLEKSSGSERLDQAAIEAVRNWRFIPAKKNNQALSATVLVPVKFSLSS